MGSIGRMKYITPVYVELKENGMIDMAWDIFRKHENFYHPIARKTFFDILSK